jgi:thiol:disulfide interchange protein DsbG
MLRQSRNLLVIVLFLIGLPGSHAAQAEALTTSRAIAGHLLEDIDEATWIAEGKGNRIVYIFFDPNCPYCHKLYEALQPQIAGKDLQLRWIPVGMLTPTSQGKAAAILQAGNPLEALRNNEDNFNFSDNGPGGGITPASTIKDQTRLDLAANLSLLQGQNIFSVPVVVFHATDGQGIMFQGVPEPERLRRLLQFVR